MHVFFKDQKWLNMLPLQKLKPCATEKHVLSLSEAISMQGDTRATGRTTNTAH